MQYAPAASCVSVLRNQKPFMLSTTRLDPPPDSTRTIGGEHLSALCVTTFVICFAPRCSSAWTLWRCLVSDPTLSAR